jgi:membrane glycosyltransferase
LSWHGKKVEMNLHAINESQWRVEKKKKPERPNGVIRRKVFIFCAELLQFYAEYIKKKCIYMKTQFTCCARTTRVVLFFLFFFYAIFTASHIAFASALAYFFFLFKRKHAAAQLSTIKFNPFNYEILNNNLNARSSK